MQKILLDKLILNKKTVLMGLSAVTVLVVANIVLRLDTSKPDAAEINIQNTIPTSTVDEMSVIEKNPSNVKIFSEKLDDLSVKIAKIQNQLDSPVVSFDPIKTQLSDLTEETKNLSLNSKHIMKDAIELSTKELNDKLEKIENELSMMRKEKEETKYVEVKELPFDVLHIDNIQGDNVVTVHYDNTVFPINIGSYLASWKLIQADFANQKAEFVNTEKQHLLVDLNRIDESSVTNVG